MFNQMIRTHTNPINLCDEYIYRVTDYGIFHLVMEYLAVECSVMLSSWNFFYCGSQWQQFDPHAYKSLTRCNRITTLFKK